MKTSIRTLLLATTILLSGACSEMESAPDMAFSDAPMEMEVSRDKSSIAPASPSPAKELADDVEQGRRLIIHNANLNVIVDNPDDAANQAQGIADTLGGFVVSATANGGEFVHSSNVSLRVPSDAFEQALARFRGLGEVDHEVISGQDVTAEFVDLESRLKVQRNLENRFLNLLQSSATVEDTLAVERELARVRTEIEQMEGRQKYLANQAQLATITVNFSTPRTIGERGALGEIGEAFEDSGEIIVTVIAGTIRVIAALLPIAALLSLIGLGLSKLVARRRRLHASLED